jgi:uncharacterized membrane protein (UPF0136 family)
VADRAGRRRSGVVFGVFFVIAGIVFLLDRTGALELGIRTLAPVLLIALGVAVLVGGRSRSGGGG